RQPSGAFSSGFSPFGSRLEIVRDLQSVSFETINGFHHGRRSRALEPSRRTPRILVCHRYQLVFHRVLVGVIQSRETGLLVSEPRFAEVEPDLPAGRAV